MKYQTQAKGWWAGALFLLAGMAGSHALAAGITDTKHNLSLSGSSNTVYSTDQTEICIFCHTPHDAIKNANIPLWNHTLSVQSYTMYSSPTMNAVPDAMSTVNASTATVSNLCLSCHDGTVAINSFNNPSNARPTTTMTGTGTGDVMPSGSANLGTDLSNDHPVNFVYDSDLVTADRGTSSTAFLTIPASASKVTGANGESVTLYGSKVQCASCHDPHTSADPTGKAFLRVTMAGSKLCLTCHIK